MFTKLQKGIMGTVTVVVIGYIVTAIGQVAVITDEAQRDRTPASHCMKAVEQLAENSETTKMKDVMQVMDDSTERSWVILVKSNDTADPASEESFFKCEITRFNDITGIAPVTPDLAQRMIDKQSATG